MDASYRDGIDMVCWGGCGGGVVIGEWDGPSASSWVRLSECRASLVAIESETGQSMAVATTDNHLFLVEDENGEWRVLARTGEPLSCVIVGLSLSRDGGAIAAATERGVAVYQIGSSTSALELVASLGESRPTSSHISPSGQWIAGVFERRVVCWRRRPRSFDPSSRVVVADVDEASTIATAVRWRGLASTIHTNRLPETLLVATDHAIVGLSVRDEDDDEASFSRIWRFDAPRLAAVAWVHCGRAILEPAERDQIRHRLPAPNDGARDHSNSPRANSVRESVHHERDNDVCWIAVACRSNSSSSYDIKLAALRHELHNKFTPNDDGGDDEREVLVGTLGSRRRDETVEKLSATALFASDLPNHQGLRQARCFLSSSQPNTDAAGIETLFADDRERSWTSRLDDWMTTPTAAVITPHPTRLLAAIDAQRLVSWPRHSILSSQTSSRANRDCCLALPMRLPQLREDDDKNGNENSNNKGAVVATTWVGDELLLMRQDGTLELWHDFDAWRRKASSASGAARNADDVVAIRMSRDFVFVVGRGLTIDAYRVDDAFQDVEWLCAGLDDKMHVVATRTRGEPSPYSSVHLLTASNKTLGVWTLVDDHFSHRLHDAEDSEEAEAVAATESSESGRVAVVDKSGRLHIWFLVSVAPVKLRRVVTLPAARGARPVDVRWVQRASRAGDDDEEAVATVDDNAAGKVRLFCQNNHLDESSWCLVADIDHAVPLSARAFVGLDELLVDDSQRKALSTAASSKWTIDDDDLVGRVAAAVASEDPSFQTPFHHLFEVAVSSDSRKAPLCGCAALAAFLASDDSLAATAKSEMKRRVTEGTPFLAAARYDRLAWWAPIQTLKAAYLESAAEVARVTRRSSGASCSRAAALPFVAAGRASTLASLAKSDAAQGSDPTAAKFAKLLTAFDFKSERGINAARKNAFSLLGKRDFSLAAAVFCLANPVLVKDAAQVAADKLDDVDAAFAIARLADENERGVSSDRQETRPCGRHARKVLRKIILPRLEKNGDHAMMALALVWLNRPVAAAMSLDELSSCRPHVVRESSDDFNRIFSALSVPALFGAVSLLDKENSMSANIKHRFRCVSIRAASVALRRDSPVAASKILSADMCGIPDAFSPPAIDKTSACGGSVSSSQTKARPSSMLAGFGAAPQRPAQQPSMLDGFDAAPRRPTQQPSMLDGFDAAPRRPAQQPSMLDGFDAAPRRSPQQPSMLDGFGAAPQRPSQQPSMLDGFGAAPQRPSQQPSMLDGFGAAPQRPSRQPSMLDGFDAAPQHAMPSNTNGTSHSMQEAATRQVEDISDEEDETQDSWHTSEIGEIQFWERQIALEASAARLVDVALSSALDISSSEGIKRGHGLIQTTAIEVCKKHDLELDALVAETLRILQGSSRSGQTWVASASLSRNEGVPKLRPLAASLLVLEAASNVETSKLEKIGDVRELAAFLVHSSIRRAYRFTLLPSAPAPSRSVVEEAANFSDELEACLGLSLTESQRAVLSARRARESSEENGQQADAQIWPFSEHKSTGLVGFATPQLAREVAAVQRALALCCDPAQRELVLALVLRHPPPPQQRRAQRQGSESNVPSTISGSGSARPSPSDSNQESSKGSSAINAATAAAIAASHGDVEGWERLQSIDRQGAERKLEGMPIGEFLLRPQQQKKNQTASAVVEESAAVAISFVAAKAATQNSKDTVCVQHAIIRVAADRSSGDVKYTSGKLGPCSSLMAILEEISRRLEPHGLLLHGVRRREAESESATVTPLSSRITLAAMATSHSTRAHKSFSRDYDDEEDEDGSSFTLNDSFHRALNSLRDAGPGINRNDDDVTPVSTYHSSKVAMRRWNASTRAAATLDVLAAAALQQQIRSLCGTSRIKGLSRYERRGHAAAAAVYEDTEPSQTLANEARSTTDCDDPPALASLACATRSLNRSLFAQVTPGILDDELQNVSESKKPLASISEEEEKTETQSVLDRHEGEEVTVSFTETGNGNVASSHQMKPTVLPDGYILAQMLHPRSGVALSSPKMTSSSWSSTGATLVSPSFAPDAAATWLVEHGHDDTLGAATARLSSWKAKNIIVTLSNNPALATKQSTPRATPPPLGSSPIDVLSSPTMREVKSVGSIVSSAPAIGVSSKQNQKVKTHFGGGGGGHGEDEGHLRYVDAWEVEPLDEDDASALMRPSMLGRTLYSPIQGDSSEDSFLYATKSQKSPGLDHRFSINSPWSSLRCDAFLATIVAHALPPAARSGRDECYGGDDEALADSCSAWPPPPSASTSIDGSFGGNEPFRARIRRHLYRNALFRRVGLRRRFVALVQVDLIALENITESLLDGADHTESYVPAPRQHTTPNRRTGQHRGASSSNTSGSAVGDAYAVLRLKHARLPGGSTAPPLTERIRTRDSIVASRKVPDNHHHRDNYWGVSAAFRFALPDEALPPMPSGSGDDESISSVINDASPSTSQSSSPRIRRRPQHRERSRLPTRGPPQAVHICVYQRAANPILSSLGLAPTENFLGDIEVPLGGLTDDEPLVQWLPLRGSGPASSWFVKVKIMVRFLLMATTDSSQSEATKVSTPLGNKRTALRRTSFSDDGRAYNSPIVPAYTP